MTNRTKLEDVSVVTSLLDIKNDLLEMLKQQESVTGEELWLKYNGTTDYRNGYFVCGIVRIYLMNLDIFQVEEPESAEFIFKMRKREDETENKKNKIINS